MKLNISQDKYVLIDDEDYDKISMHKWYCRKSGKNYYATASSNGNKIQMHRLIMNPKDNMVVDHINGNGLDNRKINLRICTKIENHINKRRPENNTSGFKGVSLTENNNWRSRIMVNGEIINLGRFASRYDAAKAYNEAAIKYHGEFARLNNI